MYGRSELASTEQSARTVSSLLQEPTDTTKLSTCTKTDVQRISNSVQEQIEQLFTDVAKDATSSFAVKYLGSLPLKDKVTSLQGLQEPLRELYLRELQIMKQTSVLLEICTTGLRVKIISRNNENNNNDENIIPFHNIAVWSAVKLVISDIEGGAAFLPLITDPENIDKTSLFRPLCGTEKEQVSSCGHAPIFAVVMRSTELPKVLKCHAFICNATDDAIVIAATLYQNLMAHVNSSSYHSTKRRTPRNQNGVSCVSIASSSARACSNYLSHSQGLSRGRRNSSQNSSESFGADLASAPRMGRKKRVSNSSLNSSKHIINEAETTTKERKRKSLKNKRAPPVPSGLRSSTSACSKSDRHIIGLKEAVCGDCGAVGGGHYPVTDSLGGNSNNGLRSESNGDILTRVAIPRSGSFLNTGGLTRYKSRAARRHTGKLGGGGGSPLGFSELFNEFRLHENLNSLDEILNAIIDADGMSFNDLKPIYKEFLLKLAVTLTKDELFQRSKNIMRRQRKKMLKSQNNASISQKKPKSFIFGTKSFQKVFHLGQFRSCRGKPMKLSRKKKSEDQNCCMKKISTSESSVAQYSNDHQRTRGATSGSDVSVVHNDNALRGLNRNSSSGYVSCSECSYDSESCTCTSADRCYCSLRTDHNNRRLRRKNESSSTLLKKSTSIDRQNATYTSTGNIHRQSLISCKSDEKCYCSMVEADSQSTVPGGGFANPKSDTSCCDTDSCVSTSKCYCQRGDRRTGPACGETSTLKSCQGSSASQRAAEKLGLDYELFMISGNNSVQPHEALSVKKSVEAAAIFAEVKLSQTTDIKSICTPPLEGSKTSVSIRNGCNADAKKYAHSAGNLLQKLKTIERIARPESVKSYLIKGQGQLVELEKHESFQRNHQSIPAENVSLEDTLGYLP